MPAVPFNGANVREAAKRPQVQQPNHHPAPKRDVRAVLAEHQDVIAEGKALGLPVVVPLTSMDSAQADAALKQSLQSVCSDPNNTLGGGFCLRMKPRPSDATGTVGFTKELTCNECKRTPWRVSYELTSGGWVLKALRNAHVGHTLCVSRAEVMVQRNGRYIPSSLDEFGSLLHEAGIAPADIYRVFCVYERRSGNAEPTFTYQDVYDKYCRHSAADAALDASGLLEMLCKRKREYDLQYFVASDAEGRIDKIFVECSGSQKVWGSVRTSSILRNVLLFDPTFGTNMYGYVRSFERVSTR